MNREIKFRAWGKNKNKMFYDVQETTCYWNGVFDSDVIQEDSFSDVLKKQDIYEVMQFTGLYDKNKVPIYEGDIVKKETWSDTAPNHRAVSYAKVVWVETLAGYWVADKNGNTFWELSEDKYNIEVAGNIYDNPELLGE